MKQFNGACRIFREKLWGDEDFKTKEGNLSNNRSDIEVISITRDFHYIIDVTYVDIRRKTNVDILNNAEGIKNIENVLERRWKRKHKKYEDYITYLRKVKRRRVRLIPIVLTRSGAWYEESTKLMSELLKKTSGTIKPGLKQSTNKIIKEWQKELVTRLWEWNSNAENKAIKNYLNGTQRNM